MNVAYRALRFVHVKGNFVARSHCLGYACGGLNGENLFLVPRLHTGYLRVFLPVLNNSTAFLALQIKSRHSDKVICANLYIGGLSAFKIHCKLKAVVYLRVSDVGLGAVNSYYLFPYDLQNLVDKVNAPVKNHTAALCFGTAPVARNTARAVNTGFNVNKLADFTRLHNFLHCKIVNIPPSVLVNGEKLTRFIGGSGHFVKSGDRHLDRLFADDIFACL